ncbi:MAG: chemotaxis protein CheW [Candidatus Omnitrophica bacterium]|nr:chemotaxis protein CheW [Candidatus Omnitrophota bacterium]
MLQQNVAKKNERNVLVFELLDEEMALDASCVREVIEPQEIRPILQAPDFIEGLINVRRFYVVAISLRKRFNIKSMDGSARIRVIICKINKVIIGLIVDNVTEVLSVPVSSIQPAPEILSAQKKGSCLSGIIRVGERTITLLDLEKILTPGELANLSGMRV